MFGCSPKTDTNGGFHAYTVKAENPRTQSDRGRCTEVCPAAILIAKKQGGGENRVVLTTLNQF
jgi:hypothetical protein